jgi:hypothetical protein
MLPEVSYTSQYRGATVERGESAVTPWDYRIIKDEPEEIQVLLTSRIRSLPLLLEKKLTLTSGSETVKIEETLTNLSPSTSLEANWGHHLAYGSPFLNEQSVISLGKGAQICHPISEESWEWPFMVADGAPIDLSVMPATGTERDLLYIKMAEHKYQLTNPLKGIGLEVRWDGKVWPYLWYWQNFMAGRDAPFFGCDYNIGLEMFNIPPKLTLSEAVEQGYALEIPPKGSISSWLEFEVIAANTK